MLEINSVKCKDRYLVSIGKVPYNAKPLNEYLFDGIHPVKTFNTEWFQVDNIPQKITCMQSQPTTNHRFVLIDDSFVSDKTPLEIPKEEAGTLASCGDFVWKEQYSFVQSLYTEVWDEVPPKEVEQEFKFNILLDMPDWTPPVDFKYPTTRESYNSYTDKNLTFPITNSDIRHQLIDSIVFPAIVQHLRPCQLSIGDTFEIIRKHVKDNINPKVSEITADYNFHLQVSKKVKLNKPYTSQRTFTPFRKRKPITESIYHSTKSIPCYDISTDGKYAPAVKSFKAESEEALKQLIDNYLENLMNVINEPLKECPTCGGQGVLADESKLTMDNIS